MKDQYFGDINDYRKYGLLRAIIRAGRLRILVAWMLTVDDGSTDGKYTLLICQHFIREKRLDFIQRMLKTLRSATPGSFVEAFSTSHVVFLMALRPEHQGFHKAIVTSVKKNWKGQIHYWDITRAQQGVPTDRSTATRIRVG